VKYFANVTNFTELSSPWEASSQSARFHETRRLITVSTGARS